MHVGVRTAVQGEEEGAMGREEGGALAFQNRSISLEESRQEMVHSARSLAVAKSTCVVCAGNFASSGRRRAAELNY